MTPALADIFACLPLTRANTLVLRLVGILASLLSAMLVPAGWAMGVVRSVVGGLRDWKSERDFSPILSWIGYLRVEQQRLAGIPILVESMPTRGPPRVLMPVVGSGIGLLIGQVVRPLSIPSFNSTESPGRRRVGARPLGLW